MNLLKARQEIESNEFNARVSVASGIATLLAAASQEEAVAWLSSNLASEEVAEKLLIRVREIASETIDPRYRNPRYVALAVYLTLLSTRYPSLAGVAAESILKAPKCFWSHHLARNWLLKGTFHSGSAENVVEVETAAAGRVSIANFETNTMIVFCGIAAPSTQHAVPVRSYATGKVLGRSSAGLSTGDRNRTRDNISFDSSSSTGPLLDQAA